MAPSTKGRDRKGERVSSSPAARKPAGKASGKAASKTARKTTRKPAVKPLNSSKDDAVLDADALEFIAALDRFKKEHNRPFPTWSEVLHVLRKLGYRKG